MNRQTDSVSMCVHTYVYSHIYIYNIFGVCTLFMKHLKKHFWEHFFPFVPKKIHNINTSVTERLKGKKKRENQTKQLGRDLFPCVTMFLISK